MARKDVKDPDPWVTVEEFAAEIRVPPGTIYSWRSRGQAPRAWKFGAAVRFRRSDVDTWIRDHLELDATGLLDAGEQ